MGQARRRGSFEERKAQALVRPDARRMNLVEETPVATQPDFPVADYTKTGQMTMSTRVRGDAARWSVIDRRQIPGYKCGW